GEIARGDESEIWHSVNSQVTLPGRAVSLKLVGANIIIAVQFTPFCRPSGEQLLVAQGQIWLEAPGKGIDYQTAFQTIPLSFGEEVRFLPLGPAEDGAEPMIEMRVVLRRYEEEELE
ncbi:MAG: hypothetical protein LBR16_01100, partial [Treponema sp.]|nr:hypothetical protein [Treponema sp.]